MKTLYLNYMDMLRYLNAYHFLGMFSLVAGVCRVCVRCSDGYRFCDWSGLYQEIQVKLL